MRRLVALMVIAGVTSAAPMAARAACEHDLAATSEYVQAIRAARDDAEMKLAAAREYAKRLEADLAKLGGRATPTEEKKP